MCKDKLNFFGSQENWGNNLSTSCIKCVTNFLYHWMVVVMTLFTSFLFFSSTILKEMYRVSKTFFMVHYCEVMMQITVRKLLDSIFNIW